MPSFDLIRDCNLRFALIFVAPVVALGLSACVQIEQKGNGGGYGGVDPLGKDPGSTTLPPVPDPSDITQMLLSLEGNDNTPVFACQTASGSHGLVINAPDEDLTQARLYEATSSSYRLIDDVNVRYFASNLQPGTSYFLSANAQHQGLNGAAGLWLRIEGKEPAPGQVFLPSKLAYKETASSPTLALDPFYCKPVNRFVPDQVRIFPRRVNNVVTQINLRIRGTEAYQIRQRLAAHAAPLGSSVLKMGLAGHLLCSGQVMVASLDPAKSEESDNCVISITARGESIVPGASNDEIGLTATKAVSSSTGNVLLEELSASNPFRNGAPGVLYTQSIWKVSGGHDVLSLRDRGDGGFVIRVQGGDSMHAYYMAINPSSHLAGGHYNKNIGTTQENRVEESITPDGQARCHFKNPPDQSLREYACEFAYNGRGEPVMDAFRPTTPGTTPAP